MKSHPLPRIGLSGHYRADEKQLCLAEAYVQAIFRAGACPVILPPIEASFRDRFDCEDSLERQVLEQLLDSLDGLVFTGGGDFCPDVIGQPAVPSLSGLNPRRDDMEFPLIRLAMKRQLPVLGICRGAQLLNLACGGDIYQDLPSEFPTKVLNHSQQEDRTKTSHSVRLVEGSLLATILERSSIEVNSLHHQAVRTVGKGLRAAAFSDDGVIEAVESAEYKSFIGVQWHPEQLNDEASQALFAWLTQEASLYRQARSIHQRAICFDAHCDAPQFFKGHYDLYQGGYRETPERIYSQVDLRKMKDGGVDSIVMAAYLKQEGRDEASLQQAAEKAQWLLNETIKRTQADIDHADIARTADDIVSLKRAGKRAIVLGIENAYALGRELERVDQYADLGVAYITLCHNGHNDVCDSASEQDRPEHNGLSDFGKKVVKAMNRRGIMVDVSHSSEKTFYDALHHSSYPIIASHSSVYALCPHPRNLKDEQIRQLAQAGGVMGICIYGGFLAKDREATIADIVAHIDYVRQLVGIDCIGIGSDFDGGGGVIGCNDCSEIICLTMALLRAGYQEEDLFKLLGENFLRVMRQQRENPSK